MNSRALRNSSCELLAIGSVNRRADARRPSCRACCGDLAAGRVTCCRRSGNRPCFIRTSFGGGECLAFHATPTVASTAVVVLRVVATATSIRTVSTIQWENGDDLQRPILLQQRSEDRMKKRLLQLVVLLVAYFWLLPATEVRAGLDDCGPYCEACMEALSEWCHGDWNCSCREGSERDYCWCG
jgi:hypothetical protein